MDEETMDDQYIDIDDNDSNTQHSQTMPGISNTYGNNPSTSGRVNNQRPASSYIEPSLDSEHSDSSEYSDWAQEDGKKLKPPPRKAQRATNQRQEQQPQRSSRSERSKRRLRIQDDDDEGEEGPVEVEMDSSVVKDKRTTLSKKLKRIVSDDEEEGGEEKMEEDESEEDEEETESSGEEDEDKPCTSSSAYTRKSARRG